MRTTEIFEIPEDLLTALENLSLSILETREAVQIVTSAIVQNRIPITLAPSEQDLN